MIIDAQNYKEIINCLFQKYTAQKNIIAIDTILEIEEEFIFQIDKEENPQ